MSTTAAELHRTDAWVRFVTVTFLRGLWSDITGEITHPNRCNNLATTASTTQEPERKEPVHLIQMLRKESYSGHTRDLARVRSEECLADFLAKHSAKADELIKAVLTGNRRGSSQESGLQSIGLLVGEHEHALCDCA